MKYLLPQYQRSTECQHNKASALPQFLFKAFSYFLPLNVPDKNNGFIDEDSRIFFQCPMLY